MTTDTKAVARWDSWGGEKDIQESDTGQFVLFTDHERVVGELRDELETLNEAQAVCDGTIPGALLHWHQRALAAESALAASRAEVEGLRAARVAYANEFPLNDDGEPDVGSVQANIRSMKKDAERYAWLVGVLRHDYRRWSDVVDHNQANVSAADFGSAIDAAMEKGNDPSEA